MTARVTPAQPFGWELERGPYSSGTCIGSIETTPSGNVALRIGAPIDGAEGWYHAGYVVLTPSEAKSLARELKVAGEHFDAA